MTDHGVIRLERRIAAPPAVVYRYLTEAALWPRWQGVAAEVDARVEGRYSVLMPGGQVAEGAFLELVPERRVVFSWGWRGHPGVPPGSSTVEIELVADGDGTILRLTHRDLPEEARPPHATGWQHYLPRLDAVAGGRDPGTDAGPPGSSPA